MRVTGRSTALEAGARERLALALIALSGIVALATAFGLEYLGGFVPCSLCILERWPWAAAVVVGAIGLLSGRARLALLVAILFLLGNTGLSAYHVGVESGWFELPGTCAAGTVASSIEELRAQLLNARPTCDRAALRVLGLSLAGWNGVAAAAIAALAAGGLLWGRRPVLSS